MFKTRVIGSAGSPMERHDLLRIWMDEPARASESPIPAQLSIITDSGAVRNRLRLRAKTNYLHNHPL